MNSTPVIGSRCGASGGRAGLARAWWLCAAALAVVVAAGGVLAAGPTGSDRSAGEEAEEAAPDGSKMVKVTLESTHESAKPGQGFWLGVVFQIEKGWHTYWRNSGDSGAAPSFTFEVEPAGALEIGSAEWMAPKRKVSEGEILDYVYEGRVTHFFPVKVSPALKPGETVKVTCKASWLVCEEMCLPGSGEASMLLRVGVSKDSPSSARLHADRALVPMEMDERTTVVWSGSTVEVREVSAGAGTVMSFFPYAEKGDAVPVNLLKNGESKSGALRLRVDESKQSAGGRVRGVVRVDAPSGSRSFVLDVPVPVPSR